MDKMVQNTGESVQNFPVCFCCSVFTLQALELRLMFVEVSFYKSVAIWQYL